MVEQASQFNPDRPSKEELAEQERLRAEVWEKKLAEADEFSKFRQEQAESRPDKEELNNPGRVETPDIPGITRPHTPQIRESEPALQSIDDLNASLESGLQNVLDGKHHLDPANDVENLAKLMDIEN